MRNIAALFCLTLAALAGCSQAPPAETAAPDFAEAPPNVDGVSFIALGDTGTGAAPQYAVAEAVATVCAQLGCQFAITLGDNIYESGVVSARDPQFVDKFELPYSELDFPFYMSLGNHDNGGTGDAYALGDFQLDYHYRTDRLSEKWQMPARWYTHVQGPIRFIAMDTNLMGQAPPAAAVTGWDPDEQKAWLQQTMAAPTEAPWTIAYGHHPYVSNGQHGDAPSSRAAFMEETICDHADILLAGHDHDLQWLAPVDRCGKTQFIVSGAGAKQRSVDSQDNQAYFATGDVNGFFWINVQGETFTARAYDDGARPLFERKWDRS